jgi:hypothetical protein
MVLAKVALANLYAPAPSTTRGESTSIAATPKGDMLVYPAGKLVVIRSALNPIQASVYNGHTCAVRARHARARAPYEHSAARIIAPRRLTCTIAPLTPAARRGASPRPGDGRVRFAQWRVDCFG